ncbi:c-type cytochrome, partial [Candidatus Methylomirabilis sp.]|uniref:cytochrome c n=1 Tax=Candidatus Methylomirabilis sp. TaxID=2032687 RepID=UPI003C796BD2
VVLAKSNVVSATVNVIPAVTLTSSVSGNTVTLRWTKSYLTGVTRYRIMRNGVRIGAVTTMSYTNSGLANGTYSYEVDAMGMYGKLRCRSNVVSVTVNVAPAPAPAPAPTDGATLYGTKCSGCHGPLATSGVKGKSAQLIQNAINNNLGGMGTLKSLTADQVSSIAGALAIAPAPAPAPQPVIDGAALYTAKCASCHEPLATSKMKGKTATQIQSAIDANKGGMGTLKSLTPEQVSAISKALGGGTTGSKFTDPDCAVCHYSDGKVRSGAGPMPGGDDD